VNPRKKIRILVPLNQWATSQPSVLKRILVFFVRYTVAPMVVLIGKVLGFCFGWCFRRSNNSIALKNQGQFAEEIEESLPFLFTEHGAKVVPNDVDVPFPPSFDGAYVTVATEGVWFQFIRGRGDFTVKVASPATPTQWEDLDLVVATLPDLPMKVGARDLWQLRGLAAVLPHLYSSLAKALDKDGYSERLDKAAAIHNERMDQYVDQLKQSGIEPRILKPGR